MVYSLKNMITKSDIQQKADYYGSILEAYIRGTTPVEKAASWEISTSKVQQDLTSLIELLKGVDLDEHRRIVFEDLGLGTRFPGKSDIAYRFLLTDR